MFGAQGGALPPWRQQQPYNQGANRNGPPPAKRAKGNPIITHYPPPPGYQGPAQPQGPYQQQTWQQPNQQAYMYGQQSQPQYPSQVYAQPQAYSQNQWYGYGQQQNNGYHSGHYYQQSHAWTAPHANGWQVQTPHPQTAPPQSAPSQTWQPVNYSQQDKQRRHTEPFVDANTGHDGPVDGMGEPLSPELPRCEVNGELENDFESECYFLRHPDEINPDWSLGEILWRPANPTRLALPSTHREATLELIAPRKTPPPGEESVSEYFFQAKRDETLLSVREQDDWSMIKDDPIFKEFKVTCKSILTEQEMVEKYKDRRDLTWRDLSATPEPIRDAFAGASEARRGSDAEFDPSSQAIDEDGDVLGNLEQALQRSTAGGGHGRHSRANSTTSITSNSSTKLRALMPVRDSVQDDVLRSLGVTGSPKMVYQTPGPAFGAPPPRREGSVSRNHSRAGSVASNHSAWSEQNPPPRPPGEPIEWARPPPNASRRLSRDQPHRNGYVGSRCGSNASRPPSSGEHYAPSGSRPGSRGSQHTASGSDFGHRDDDRTPRPKAYRMDSRKRGYDDYDNGDRYGGRDHDEDATPRQQRYYKQPRVDDAYGRR